MASPKQRPRSCRNGLVALVTNGSLHWVPAYCQRKVCPTCGPYKFRKQVGGFLRSTQHLPELWVAILFQKRDTDTVSRRTRKLEIQKSTIVATGETRLSILERELCAERVSYTPVKHGEMGQFLGDFTDRYGHRKWISSWSLDHPSDSEFLGRGADYDLIDDLRQLGYDYGSYVEDTDYLRARLYVLQQERKGTDSVGFSRDDDGELDGELDGEIAGAEDMEYGFH